jgi:hypothetical protein
MFSFIPHFRPSSSLSSLSTLPGLASSLAIIITTILFITTRFSTLINYKGVNLNQIVESNGYLGKDEWTFTVGQKDDASGYGFNIAFGVYNFTSFKPPTEIERIGTPKAFMYNMRTNADGGIIAEKVDLKLHTCNMGDIEIFN